MESLLDGQLTGDKKSDAFVISSEMLVVPWLQSERRRLTGQESLAFAGLLGALGTGSFPTHGLSAWPL